MKKGDYDAVYGCWISSIFGNFQLWDPITQKRLVAQQKKNLLNLLRVVKNASELKLFCFNFFTTRHRFLPFAKNCAIFKMATLIKNVL